MAEEGHLIKAAIELVESLTCHGDENFPGELAGIVKVHAKIAVATND